MKGAIFVLFAMILVVPNVLGEAKVHVGVYYESLCPTSVHFIRNQLSPIYSSFEQYIDIEFVPFGKSKSVRKGNKVSFTCQHGPDECYGNKVHSCAIEEAEDQAAQVGFVACQMGSGIRDIQTCAEKANLSYQKVLECSNSEAATKLQLENEVKSKRIAAPREMLSFVPTIVYNHQYDDEKQDRSLSGFRKVLCEEIESISGKVPSVCA